MAFRTRRLTRLISTLAAALLILFSVPWWQGPAVTQAQGPPPKVSSLLDMQIKVKSRYLAKGGQVRAAEVVLPRLVGRPLEEVSRQKIFIRFKKRPTAAQVRELQALGLTVYPDSWIPPVGKHPTGFIYAEMPIQKVGELSGLDYVVSLQSAEHSSRPLNNLAAQAMGVNSVWGLGFTGSGVTVAVLDSGLDLTQPDIPTPVAKKDYSNYPTSLDDTIANTVTGHGTHVTGSVLGRGTSSVGNVYKGSAPGASLVFLKIGNDTDAAASDPAMIAAIRAAVDTYGARVITISYGGWSTYHDGSGEVCQAVDYAVSRGATYFGSAGNEADLRSHYSGTVAAGSATDFIAVNVSAGSNDTSVAFNLVWFDGTDRNNLDVEYYDSSFAQVLSTSGDQSQSWRGTESRYSHMNAKAPSGSSIWYIKVRNNSSNSQLFHLYYDEQYNTGSGGATFQIPDPNYTISDPAEADGAIAVGAYVTRTTWTNYLGNTYPTGRTPNSIAIYSSRGPRVDTGAPGKPNVVAPGSVLISVRDTNVYPLGGSYTSRIISNDPVNNGSPADYLIMEGTSMSSPQAAAVGALLLSKNPNLTPAHVRSVLESTASDKGSPGWDSTYGWGLINALAAVNGVPTQGPVASFTKILSPSDGIAPCTVAFAAAPNDPPQTWSWNFGDGTGSSSQNPTMTYNTAGNYNVGLTVTNPAGSSSTSQTVSVYTTPVAAFTASATSANPGSPIIFTDQSTGNIVSWSWSFGDGTDSSSRNPTKTYASEGTYTVALTVVNPAGSNTLSRTGYIQIVNYAAETAIIQGVTAGSYAYVGGYINRFFNYADGSLMILADDDGIGTYDACMSYSAAGVTIKAAAGVAPFSSPSFALNTLGGTASTISAPQIGSTPKPPIELFRFYPSLIGSKDLACTITLHFNTITRVVGGQVPQNADATKTFKRGDAQQNGNVNITDALFIAQYRASLRTLGEGSGQVWPVNAATPRNDSPTAGDSITITDALFIAQMLAGLRDASYNLVT